MRMTHSESDKLRLPQACMVMVTHIMTDVTHAVSEHVVREDWKAHVR